jgi:hypothetical protein
LDVTSDHPKKPGSESALELGKAALDLHDEVGRLTDRLSMAREALEDIGLCPLCGTVDCSDHLADDDPRLIARAALLKLG